MGRAVVGGLRKPACERVEIGGAISAMGAVVIDLGYGREQRRDCCASARAAAPLGVEAVLAVEFVDGAELCGVR